MLKETINGREVVMYNSIAELPSGRYHWFNRQLSIDSGVGSDLNAFNRRCQNIKNLIHSDPVAAHKEVANLQGTMYFIMNNISPKMSAFSALVYEIDSTPIRGAMSNELVDYIRKELENVPHSWFENMIKQAQRTFRREMNAFFKSGNNGQTKGYYQNLQRAMEKELEHIQNGELEGDVSELDKFLQEAIVIQNYLGTDGVQIKDINGYEKACGIISKYFSDNPKELTALEFQHRFELMKKAAK